MHKLKNHEKIIKKPVVSVVIPVHNAKETIYNCLNGVVLQNFKNYEVIVVDNNSNDDSKEIILSFVKKYNFVHYVFENNISRASARNAGIKAAKADVIAMIDSDCIPQKDWLRRITYHLFNDSYLVSMGNHVTLGDDFVSKQISRFNKSLIKERQFKNNIYFFDTKNCAFKKEVLKITGLFNSKFKNSEDSGMGIRLLSEKIPVFFESECYVMHNHSMNLFDWFLKQQERAYYLKMAYSLYNIKLDKQRKVIKRYYFGFNFIHWWFLMPFHILGLIFLPNKKNRFFDIITGVSYSIGFIRPL